MPVKPAPSGTLNQHHPRSANDSHYFPFQPQLCRDPLWGGRHSRQSTRATATWAPHITEAQAMHLTEAFGDVKMLLDLASIENNPLCAILRHEGICKLCKFSLRHHHATTSHINRCDVTCMCNYLLQPRPGLGVCCARPLRFCIPRTWTDWLP